MPMLKLKVEHQQQQHFAGVEPSIISHLRFQQLQQMTPLNIYFLVKAESDVSVQFSLYSIPLSNVYHITWYLSLIVSKNDTYKLYDTTHPIQI